MNPLKHVAIIMDGNGRWGVKHKKSRNLGHKEGLNTVEKIIRATIKNKIKYLSSYQSFAKFSGNSFLSKFLKRFSSSV